MMRFELLEAEEYYQSLLKEIPRAKQRVTIAAMVVLWGERTAPIFDMLTEAVERGVKVTVLLDTYTRLTYLLDLDPSTSGPERLKQTYRRLEALSAKGAAVYNFGKIVFPPHKGRCHLKVTVIDDISYSFGGVNFNDEMFSNSDYMLMSRNPEVADCLDQLVAKISGNRPPLTDGEVQLDPQTTILFDGGARGRSLIYERACELTAQAKNVQYASQMVPSGQLARLLNENHAEMYFNRAEQMGSLSGIAQAFDQQKYRVTNRYRGTTYIHAKAMLFELPGRRKVLLSSSHNFSYRGVAFGTQEIALYSTDPALWSAIERFIRKRIVKAR
ncbi:MAG TPA: phospholipase D-like domain-containing protein [Candidatus Pristimantibacillus sp.]|jgi:hypothetical protein|nr:phospholipase D-like domain-containing protein [Candidatus Pristimantibacillus sp.]